MTRYQVFGSYDDEPQVVIDIVDAETEDEAIAKVIHARGGPESDYENDGAETLQDAIDNLQALLKQSPEHIAAELAELASYYAHYHDED